MGGKCVIEFSVAGLPKMSNQLLHAGWRVSIGNTNTWKRKVWKACWHLAPAKPLEKAKLTLIRCSSTRPDSDGLVSGFKPCIDGLVEAKILINDSFEVIGMPTYDWQQAKRNGGRIIIKVEEL